MKIVGIDEVGKGPLAGPVTVCVVSCEESFYKKLKQRKDLPPKGIDSKKLLPEAREKYAKILKNLDNMPRLSLGSGDSALFSYTVVHVSNKIIDRAGITFAIKRAINLGIKKLKLNPTECHVLLDGGLKAPKEFENQQTIIKGDEKEKIIAWASILAKVSRDQLMQRNAKKFPGYGFEHHKGYGTRAHKKVINEIGLSHIHRISWFT